MPQLPEQPLELDKSHYLMKFVTKRRVDVANLALGDDKDAAKAAASLLVFALEVLLGGVEADEAGIQDYWQALRAVEDALNAAGLPA